MTDFELLLVDDYSTDNSLKIIEELGKEDNRIKIIRNKQNRGSLYSRSIGTFKAKGKYIMALDSDDLFINENIFNICYNEVETYNLDILEFAGFHIKRRIIKNNNKLPKKAYYLRFKKYNKILKQPMLFNSLYKKNNTQIIGLIDAYIWGKCIKKKIYKKALVRLGEKIYSQNLNFGEDRIVNFVLFQVASSFKYINEYGIIYYNNPNSIYNSYNKELILHDELINLISIYNFTKNTTFLSILSYEIIFRWESVIKPGLNKKNIEKIKYLINLLLISEYIQEKDKNILALFLNELK
jgi:glycosyltransferase involved in cell wall biosynthesis